MTIITKEQRRHDVAQLWCLPSHSAKEIDVDLAEDMATLLDAADDIAREDRDRLQGAIETLAVERDAARRDVVVTRQALRICVEAFEIQARRESGDMHLSAEAMSAEWRDALRVGRLALGSDT